VGAYGRDLAMILERGRRYLPSLAVLLIHGRDDGPWWAPRKSPARGAGLGIPKMQVTAGQHHRQGAARAHAGRSISSERPSDRPIGPAPWLAPRGGDASRTVTACGSSSIAAGECGLLA
jgi:hypothetical protein